VEHARPAYTLMELVIVLAVLVVLATLVYPSIDAMYGDYRVTGATDMVRSAWAVARSRAIDESQAYRFSIVPGRGNFRIAPDNANYWGGDAPPPSDQTTPPLVQDDALPKGVRFVTADAVGNGAPIQGGDSALPPGGIDPGMWTTVVTFLPDGTADQDAELIFNARGARTMVLRLRGLTGVVIPPRPFGGEDGRP
jgi:prepilin-type N-terminal cleavage/methylation domain-containing protein